MNVSGKVGSVAASPDSGPTYAKTRPDTKAMKMRMPRIVERVSEYIVILQFGTLGQIREYSLKPRSRDRSHYSNHRPSPRNSTLFRCSVPSPCRLYPLR